METAIISGKGGTGKSCIAAAFATLEKKLVLADCDVDAANLYILFDPLCEEEQAFTGSREAVLNAALCDTCGICRDYCRFGAISLVSGRLMISEIFCDGCGLCERVCPQKAIVMKENSNSRLITGAFRYGTMVYGKLAAGEENSGKLVSLVREKARDLAKRDNMSIILDGPPGIGCPVIATITGVGKVVMVTEPSISGIHDIKRIGGLCQSLNLPVFVIINKYDLHAGKSRELEDYCDMNNFILAGKIPYDPLVIEAMVQCKSINEWAPDSTVATAVEKAYKLIINN
jgi:MinD superfamily P-loop ATPase